MWESLDEQAAETVRRHLVALRGGAPFLSSEDASLLETWLRDGWTAPQIVHALERAADARRKRPSRIPLSLQSARRHLGKTSRGRLKTAKAPSTDTHPLHAMVRAVRSTITADDPRGEELASLADALQALPTADPVLLEARAQALCRDFLLAAWETMSDWERQARQQDARRELASLAGMLSEAALDASAEELARDQLRQAYPLLSAATVRQALAT